MACSPVVIGRCKIAAPGDRPEPFHRRSTCIYQMSITEKPINLPLPVSKIQADDFQTAEVITVAGAHGAHDTYFSFLPTILPLLIEKFSLSTAQAGFLTAFSQIPNLLQPLIGLLADRKNLKMLVVLAPALSGCLITLMGVAPNYGTVALLLLLAGFSTAGFHAIAPGMVGAHAGRKVGRGMGFFMVGGELGFSIGPLLVVATIGYLTLRGLPWLMVFGLLASFILYFRLRQVILLSGTLKINPACRCARCLLSCHPFYCPLYQLCSSLAFSLPMW